MTVTVTTGLGKQDWVEQSTGGVKAFKTDYSAFQNV